MELDNCVTHSTLTGSIYHIFGTKLQNHHLKGIYDLFIFFFLSEYLLKVIIFIFLVNQYTVSISR